MTTAAGALDILVTADTAEASSSLSRFAATAEREMQRTARASQQAQRESDRMTTGLQKQIDTFGMSGSEIQKYEMRLKGASAAQLEMVDRLQRMRDAAAAFNSTGSGGLNSEGIKSSAHAMEGFSFATAGAKRELLVLAHELSQGNYKQFGGSLMVLGERTGAASLLFSGLGIAALAAVAVIGGLAFEIYRGAKAFEELNKAMLLTGNFAGLTPDKFSRVAASVAGVGTGTQSQSQEALQAVVASGVFGPEVIGAATEATLRLSALTGETADKVVAEFAKMGDGVAKYAADHDKSMHLLTLSEYEHIKALEESGHAIEAQGVYFGALNNRLREHDKEISEVGKYWQAVKIVVDEYIQAVANIGKGSTIGSQLMREREKLADLQTSQGSSFRFRDYSGDISETQQTIAALESSQHLAEQVATATARSRKEQDAGKSASDFLDKIDKETKGVDRQKKAIDELHQQQKAYLTAGGTLSPERIAAEEAEVMRRNAPPKAHRGPKSEQDKLDSAFDKAMNTAGEENAKLDAEIASFEQFGKAVNKSRVAVLEFDVAQGKLTGKGGAALTGLQMYALWEKAYDADLKQESLDQLKAGAAADKRTKSIEAAANAQAMNARQTKVASELAELENSGLVKGSALYEQKAAARTAAVNAEFDSKLKQELAAQSLSVDAEIRKLDEETRLLGLSTVERLKSVEALKLETAAKKLIAANPEQTAQILEAMVIDQNKVTAAVERTYEARRTADAGVAQALQKYQEEATNYAKSANELTTKVLGGLEDGLMALFTGKKFSWKSFVDSILNEITRLYVIKPLMASLFGQGSTGGNAMQSWLGSGGLAGAPGVGGGGQGLLGGLGGLLGGITGSGWFAQATAPTMAAGTGLSFADAFMQGLTPMATGTNYVPHDMPAFLHKGETVTPAAYSPQAAESGGRPIVVNVTMPQGATRENGTQFGAAIARQLAVANRRNN